MKITKFAVISLFAIVGGLTAVSAQYYQTGYTSNYYNTQNSYQQSYGSYSYVNGCYQYYYNAITRTTSITGYNCQTAYQNYTAPTYTYYTQPVTYTAPTYYTSPYQTYGYSNGVWYLGYNSDGIFSRTNNSYYGNGYANDINYTYGTQSYYDGYYYNDHLCTVYVGGYDRCNY